MRVTSLSRLFKDGFYAWRAFHLTQRRLYIVSLFLQQEQERGELNFDAKRLAALNSKRMIIQREIASVSRKSNACSKCRGNCCSGDPNLFTAVDYVIRKYSDKPLISYGYIPESHELLSNYNALKKQLRYFLKSSHLSEPSRASSLLNRLLYVNPA
jgi:hypothetical protein